MAPEATTAKSFDIKVNQNALINHEGNAQELIHNYNFTFDKI